MSFLLALDDLAAAGGDETESVLLRGQFQPSFSLLRNSTTGARFPLRSTAISPHDAIQFD
jgi:hypothetical protein